MEDCCPWVPIFLQWLLVAIQSSKVTSYRRSLGGTFGCWGLYGIDHDWPVSERGFLDVLCHHINYWLAVWNHGILYDFHILGISSSQLTKSYFFRGVGQPPTRLSIYITFASSIPICRECLCATAKAPTMTNLVQPVWKKKDWTPTAGRCTWSEIWNSVYHICHRLSMACGSHINVCHMMFHDFSSVHVAVAQRQRSTRPCMRHHKTVSSPERCFKAYWKSGKCRVCPKLGEKIWL